MEQPTSVGETYRAMQDEQTVQGDKLIEQIGLQGGRKNRQEWQDSQRGEPARAPVVELTGQLRRGRTDRKFRTVEWADFHGRLKGQENQDRKGSWSCFC
jgi:hypothetical protein